MTRRTVDRTTSRPSGWLTGLGPALTAGVLEVVLMRLRTMGPATVVGEVTLYLGTPRTATVVAEVPSRLHLLSADALARMERGDPTVAAAVHKMFARLLAERLNAVEALLD